MAAIWKLNRGADGSEVRWDTKAGPTGRDWDPEPDQSIPLDVRRELFKAASAKVRRQLDEKGISEEQVDRDIAALFEDDRR